MANTVWKGQLTFGLVSFPVRLVRAARKDRIPLRYVRQVDPLESEDDKTNASSLPFRTRRESEEDEGRVDADRSAATLIAPVRQAYVTDEEDKSFAARELDRGHEIAPGQFAVIRSEELRQLRRPTSGAMEILRSVRMKEIDPVFLETSYYVVPGNGGEYSYSLFYRALKESAYAALAEVTMHGRHHVVVIRPGGKGLIAHTMYYVNEVRGSEEHPAEAKDVAPKELDLAKRFVEAIAGPFRPEEFTDHYRKQLESLIASKEAVPTRVTPQPMHATTGKVVDIMEALRKSLEAVKKPAAKAKSVARTATPKKTRLRY